MIRRQAHNWLNGYGYDAVQLSTGEIFLVVDTYDDLVRPVVAYSILNSQTLALIKGPTTIDDPASVGGATAVAVTANRNGQTIVTWENDDWGYGAYVHYALINNAGQVVTPPTIYYTVQPDQPFVGMGLNGYDLTSYKWIPSDGVDGRVRLASALSGGEPGKTASLAIEVGNNGAKTATGVMVKLEMDPALAYVNDTSGITPSVNGNVVQWQIPDLRLLERRSFRVNVRLPEDAELGTRYPLTFSLAAAEAEVNPDDNSTSADAFVARQILLPTISRP